MDDYQNASERHLQDAELLLFQRPQRLANASHLFGLSAECSLKAIARNFNPNKKFSGSTGHIPGLFAELKNVSPAPGGNTDVIHHITQIEQQFRSWNVSQRYASQTEFVTINVEHEKTGANDAYRLMTNHLHGLI